MIEQRIALSIPAKISQARFQQFCRAKDFSAAYLESSPLLSRSLITGIQIAVCEPVELEQMLINNSYTGALQGVLDAMTFFVKEVDAHEAISHVVKLLAMAGARDEEYRFHRAFEYFGAALRRRCATHCRFFTEQMLSTVAQLGDRKIMRGLIGMRSGHLSLYTENEVLPMLGIHSDAKRLVEVIGADDLFGEFCIKNALTTMARYLTNKEQRGRLLELALGM